MNNRLKKNNKNINRKGFASTLQIALLSIAVILVLGLFLYNAYTSLKDKMAIQSCKDSISAHSLVAKGSGSNIFTDIKCPTNEITIKDLKKTNEIIAEDMHRCWYIWNEGNGQYFKGDGTFCQICSIYQFGDKKQEVHGLIEYLINNNVEVKYAGEVPGVKYVDYFQGYSTPNANKKVSTIPQDISYLDTLNTSQKYATIFVFASGKDAIAKMLENGKRTTAITGLALFGVAGGAGSIGAAGLAAAGSTAGGELAIVSTIATEFGTISIYGTTAATTGTFLAVTPIGWVIVGAGIVALVGHGIYTLIDVPNPEWVSYIAFRPYNADELNSLGCEKLDVNQMSNAGTS